MPVYEYEHEGKSCSRGKVFEFEQAVSEKPLSVCPTCGKKVKRLISVPSLSFPKTTTELKDQGFTKLVRRDQGVYENVTARDGESRVVHLGDRKTYPDLKRRKK